MEWHDEFFYFYYIDSTFFGLKRLPHHTCGGGYCNAYLSPSTTKDEKGIAALFIVLHHISQAVNVSGLLSIMGYIGFILVAVFFFISGFGLMHGLQNKPDYLTSFFRRRFLPVLIPYWIVNTVSIICYYVQGKIFSISQYIFSYLGSGLITKTWFVPAILLMYFFFWLSFKLRHSYLVMASCLVIYCVTCNLLNLHSSYTASISAFILGVLWSRIDTKFVIWIRQKYWVKLMICVSTFGILFVGRLGLASIGVTSEMLHLLLRNIISAVFIIMLIAVTQKIEFHGKVLEWLGNISYELYIVQFLLLSIFSGINQNAYVVLVLCGSLLLGTLLLQCDKKIRDLMS